MSHIGERIKKRRLELHYTQEQLAYKMGYTNKSTITRIEKGINDVNQSKIVAFADVLQTTPSYLMGWTDNPAIDLQVDDYTKKVMERNREMHLTNQETEIIYAFRNSDEKTRKMVLMLLDIKET